MKLEKTVHTFDLIASEQLPKNFKSELIECSEHEYVLKANLRECDNNVWVHDFVKSSNTQWIVRHSRIGTIKTSKQFVCRHSEHSKVDKDENGCNKRSIFKNPDCQTKICISGDLCHSKRSRDSYVKVNSEVH